MSPVVDDVLEVRDLRVDIRSRRSVVHAVDGASFDVPRGEAMGLVVESGYGKSMTQRAILGVLPPGVKSSRAARYGSTERTSHLR
jgi:ABC-type glutathione transport system ATPase component